LPFLGKTKGSPEMWVIFSPTPGFTWGYSHSTPIGVDCWVPDKNRNGVPDTITHIAPLPNKKIAFLSPIVTIQTTFQKSIDIQLNQSLIEPFQPLTIRKSFL
jgi:hypothetical protein